MTSGASRGPSRDAASLQADVVRFLSTCQQPALVDPGQPVFGLQPDRHSIEVRAGGLVIQVWDESRNLVRRVTGILSEKRGRMELEVARFGGKPGKLILADLAAAAGVRGQRDAGRLDFREQFRRFLRREFPSWRTEVSAEIDLEHSFSGACSRAFLRKGQAGFAAVGAPPGTLESGRALAAGLLWLDYLRRRYG